MVGVWDEAETQGVPHAGWAVNGGNVGHFEEVGDLGELKRQKVAAHVLAALTFFAKG